MKVTVFPSIAKGTIKAQPSKSAAHRLIIAAALAKGRSVIGNVVLSDDIKATLNGIRAFGADCSVSENTVTITSEGFCPIPESIVDCHESGSTLRFLLPLAMTAGVPINFVGKERLMARPLLEYEKICKQDGIKFERTENGITVCGKLKSESFSVRGDVSSQYVTGLLFASALRESDTVINVLPPIESKPYIDITLDVFDTCKIKYLFSENSIKIFGKQKFSAVSKNVEGDYSNAAFPSAFGLIGGDVEISGLDCNTKQGDAIFERYFAEIKDGRPILDVKNCPDLAPILMATAAIKNGAVLENTARLKFKESDRGNAMKEELEKFGAKISVEENRITVEKADLHSPTEELSSHNDHRIAMALSVVCSVTGGTITEAEAVAKSYPQYWKETEELGIEVKYE